jgi:hypothetical protein
MANPSHEIRALQRTYETCHSSHVEMVAHLNQLQAHYVHVKRTGKLDRAQSFKVVGVTPLSVSPSICVTSYAFKATR